jgi:hypothetical protein
MRATRLICLVILGVLVNGALLPAGDREKKQHQPRPMPRKWIIAGQRSRDARQQPPEPFRWSAEGFGATEQDARLDAIKNGRQSLMDYLAEQGFSLEWQPSNDFMQKLVEKWAPVKKDLEHEDNAVDLKVSGLDEAQGWTAHFLMASNDFESLLAQERQYRAGQRMSLLSKGLAGLVALLAAVAGYFRLEEATKGYYTAWLRAGAIAFVGAAGAGIWLLS